MTEESVAAQLQEWTTITDHALKNILDLKEHPIYQRIIGGELAGKSAERAAREHLLQKDDLFKSLAGIQTQIERAANHLQEIGFLNRGEKLKEIERILTQPVIVGEEVIIALAERQISTAASQTPVSTLAQAMASLTGKFDAARRLVGELETAQRAVYQTFKDWDSKLDMLRCDEPSLVASAEQAILAATSLVEADPLGAWERLLPVTGQLTKAQEQAATVEQRRARLRHELAAAHVFWSEWSARHQTVRKLQQEFQVKISTTQTVASPSGDEAAGDWNCWLADLSAASEGPSWKSVEVGLRKWRMQVEAADGTDHCFAEAARALLDRRLELRGLLEALKSKVNALGLSEAPALDQAYQAARQLLYQRPTPLEEAERRVDEFRRLAIMK